MVNSSWTIKDKEIVSTRNTFQCQATNQTENEVITGKGKKNNEGLGWKEDRGMDADNEIGMEDTDIEFDTSSIMDFLKWWTNMVLTKVKQN